jgi:hypothetical protein
MMLINTTTNGYSTINFPFMLLNRQHTIFSSQNHFFAIFEGFKIKRNVQSLKNILWEYDIPDIKKWI